MAPLRQPRAVEDLLQLPNGTNTRHIHAREKDVLHKTVGSTGISKSKKAVNPARTPIPTPSAAPAAASSSEPRVASQSTNTIPRPIWRTGPGSSEQRMKWSSMSLSALNKWRSYLALQISAPFSSESARISLEHTDSIGSHSATMSGLLSRRPRARSEVEQAIAEVFENSAVDEDEVIATFLAKGEEERRIAGRIGVLPAGGAGSSGMFVTEGKTSGPARCRSDMLS